jgi:hypothetical protein
MPASENLHNKRLMHCTKKNMKFSTEAEMLVCMNLGGPAPIARGAGSMLTGRWQQRPLTIYLSRC